MIDAPRETPQVPTPPDDAAGTDPGSPVTVGQLRQSNALQRYFAVGLAFVFSSGAGSCGVVSALSLVRSEARAEARELVVPIDAGLKGHEARLATLEQQRIADRAETDARLERIERNQAEDRALSIGVSKKLDALLEKARLPNPAPAPSDGGPR